jgi:hypothetical protein
MRASHEVVNSFDSSKWVCFCITTCLFTGSFFSGCFVLRDTLLQGIFKFLLGQSLGVTCQQITEFRCTPGYLLHSLKSPACYLFKHKVGAQIGYKKSCNHQ